MTLLMSVFLPDKKVDVQRWFSTLKCSSISFMHINVYFHIWYFIFFVLFTDLGILFCEDFPSRRVSVC